MVMYAQETDATRMDPVNLSERLAMVMRDAMPWLVTVSEAEASVPEAEGKWSGKQVVGHLIDSAVNNLGRMVRMQIASGQSMPGYEQRAWVDLQRYAEREWSEVLALWFALNEHLRWTVRSIDRELLTNEGRVGGETLTLGFLIVDYIAHMEHHLRAMQLWIRTPDESE
jgi:hypothetical protein